MHLEDWVEKWLMTLSVKPKTKASYESLLRSRILPAFGRRRLANIRPSDVQGWVSLMHEEGEHEMLTEDPLETAMVKTRRHA